MNDNGRRGCIIWESRQPSLIVPFLCLGSAKDIILSGTAYILYLSSCNFDYSMRPLIPGAGASRQCQPGSGNKSTYYLRNIAEHEPIGCTSSIGMSDFRYASGHVSILCLYLGTAILPKRLLDDALIYTANMSLDRRLKFR